MLIAIPHTCARLAYETSSGAGKPDCWSLNVWNELKQVIDLDLKSCNIPKTSLTTKYNLKEPFASLTTSQRLLYGLRRSFLRLQLVNGKLQALRDESIWARKEKENKGVVWQESGLHCSNWSQEVHLMHLFSLPYKSAGGCRWNVQQLLLVISSLFSSAASTC